MKAGRILKILVFLIGVLLISSAVLILIKPEPAYQIPIVGDIVRHIVLEEPRSRVIGLLEGRLGYKLCGEYQLKHGVNAIDLFFIRNDTFACYYLFKLPEPREKYKLYDAWVVIHLAPARPEDMDKTYYFGAGGGTYEYPHVWVNPAVLVPFSYKTDKPQTFLDKAPGNTVEDVDAGHSDVYAAVSYKPEEPGMPIKVLIEVYATVLTVDEKWDISYRKTPEYTLLGNLRDDISETLNREARHFLESLGYKFCGEYYLKGESDTEELNITYVVDKPYEGEACYFVVNLPRPAMFKEFWEKHPVNKTDLSRTHLENITLMSKEGVRSVGELFWAYFDNSPIIEKLMPYSHREFVEGWGGDCGSGDWSGYYSFRYIVFFYFKVASDKPREDVVIVYSAVLFFKYVDVEELGPP